jgi:hypothetical protein
MFDVSWQVWRDIGEETAEAMGKGCDDVGLRKEHLEYHNTWDYWYFTFLVRFCVLHCVDIGSAY